MVLIPGTYTKQPSEREYIEIKFDERVADGDSLSSITECKCYDEDGTDTTADMVVTPVIVSNSVKLWVQAGTKDKKYDLTVKAETTNGYKLEEDLKISVLEEGHA